MRWVDWLEQVGKMVRAWRGQQLLANGSAGALRWTTWMDPGKATGLASAIYLVPPALVAVEGVRTNRVGERIQSQDTVSMLGGAVDAWSKVLAGIRAENVPGGLLPTYDATGAIVLSYFSEFLSGDENAMVRVAMSRVRGLGAIWYGSPEWDVTDIPETWVDPTDHDGPWCGLGRAGVGAETFTVLMLDSSQDYVSPLRVRSAFSYALEDEFGVRLMGNSPADAKNTFGALQLKHLGMWVPGPDHVRDALSHVLFGIRKGYGML